jgi:hypothetical protein
MSNWKQWQINEFGYGLSSHNCLADIGVLRAGM